MDNGSGSSGRRVPLSNEDNLGGGSNRWGSRPALVSVVFVIDAARDGSAQRQGERSEPSNRGVTSLLSTRHHPGNTRGE
jgi:hypothetical protein